MKIPEKINNFNAYTKTVEESNKLVGVTDEIALPSIEYLSETLSMAGMGGEIDSPTVGQIKSIQIEIPFKNISEKMFNLVADGGAIILKAAQEVVDTATNGKSYQGATITISGMTKSINFGKLKKGGYGDPSITKEVIAFKYEAGDETLVDIDKWGTRQIINGQEVTKGISDLI